MTFAHTIAGSNTILFIDVWTRGGGAGWTTGVTWNGVSASSTNPEVLCATASGDEYLQTWVVVGADTGTHNVVVSTTGGTHLIDASATSYTGVRQTAQPDAKSSQANTLQTNTTATLTTIADGSWAHLALRSDSGDESAGAGTTMRGGAVAKIFDGNSEKTPAGSYSLVVNHTSGRTGFQMTSFAPASTGGGGGTITYTHKQKAIIW